MDFDNLLNQFGGIGRYQWIIFFVCGLFSIINVSHNIGIVFLAAVPEHHCTIPDLEQRNISDDVIKNISIPLEEKDGELTYSSCRMYDRNYSLWDIDNIQLHLANGNLTNDRTVACQSGWSYDKSVYISSIVTEWDLVCDKRWLHATSSAVYMFGGLIGLLVIGSLSDIWGRYPTLVACLGLCLTLGITAAFSPNIIVFLVIRFFMAVFDLGMYTIAFVTVMEIVGPKWRARCGTAYMYFFPLGYMVNAGVAYLLREWWKLQLYSNIAFIVFLIAAFILPESPRWLYTKEKTKRADAVVRKMARMNGVELPENLDVTVKKDAKGYIWDLVRTPHLRWRSFAVFFNWFVNNAVYYGLSLNSSNLGGNDYLNFFISGAVEIPGYLVAQMSADFLGRRVPLCCTMVLGGVALLCTMAVPAELYMVTIALSMFGKLCICASFAIIYVFTAELYPTVVRGVAVSTASSFGRVGGILAPYIAQLSIYSKIIPVLIFGVMSIAGGLLALLLPETKGRPLPETIEDGENFGRENRCQTSDTHLQNSRGEPIGELHQQSVAAVPFVDLDSV